MNPLSVDSLAKIFSHSVGSLFILLRVSFAVQKLVNLIKSHLFIFVFTVITLRGGSEKMLLSFMSEILPMLSTRSLMVFCHIFKSFSHFEFIFVHGVRVCSSFIALHAAVQVSQQCLLNRLSFSHFMFLPPLSKIN
uniref:Uncharacterized protein n=1 Tax=Sus scrofa TaxID=9823 RepID=A0A8W4FQ54_PIG